MAIAFDAATAAEVAISPSASLTFSHTVGTLTNGALFVGIGYYNRLRSVGTVTYGGVSLTKRLRYDNGSAQATTELWYLANPPSGANNVVITMASSTAGIEAGAISLSGVHQTTPIEADNAGDVVTGTHTTHSDSCTTVTADAWLLDVLLASGSGFSATESGQTARCQSPTTVTGDSVAMSTRPIASPGASTSGWSFSSLSIATNLMIVSVKPASDAVTNPGWFFL